MWLDLLLDPDGRTPLFEDVLHEGGGAAAAARVRSERRKTGLTESVGCVEGRLGAHRVVACIFAFDFLGGSLGLAAGERLLRAFERGALLDGVIVVVASGGVRVQEGISALMQMARLMSARARLAEARRPLIAIATDPTAGGVAASVVASADVVLAEPEARLALVGPRAMEAMGLVPELHTAEEARRAGVVDQVVQRSEMRRVVSALLDALVPAP